ncbi:MAG TPA: response regulator [Flavitalea sp.]|nr:response regulator [Flavitalea sp.]
MKQNHPVIVIDDDEDDRFLIREGLQKAGCNKEIIQFENGREFLRFLQGIPKNEHPSIIMLDLNMPVMDGKEVLKELKGNARFRQIPVIIYSTSNISMDREYAITNGANCYISKPGTFDELVDIMKSISMLWCFDSSVIS